MRVVIQRALNASVRVEDQIVGETQRGILALVGIHPLDDEKVIDKMLDKIINLRIFEDGEGKMNLSLKDVRGGLLVVPNFTLYGDARKGRRPSFTEGAPPQKAEVVFSQFVFKAKELYGDEQVQAGIFQADMKVQLINDGPVTLILDI